MMKHITKQIKSIILNSMVLAVSCLIIVATGNIAGADVGGSCNDCHTMHYSQNGTVPLEYGMEGPYEILLKDDCIGCHTAPDGSTDPRDDTYHTPFVQGTALSDGQCLAGGFFTDDTDDENHDDNSHTLGSTETPVGYNPSGEDWYKGDDGGEHKFTCAGATGCHGNQTSVDDTEAIKKGHHNVSSTYRMLYVDGDPVVGKGCGDYEEGLITGASSDPNYNVYSAGEDEVTISDFCGKCHGNFHLQGSSPFVRHPTDIDIPHTGGGYEETWGIVNDNGTAHDTNYDDEDRVNNPLGFAEADETKVGRVTCLSCHRAHGTGNNDILRFDYDLQIAGDGDVPGCLSCHNNQR